MYLQEVLHARHTHVTVSLPSSAVDPDLRLKKLLHFGSVPKKELVDPYCTVFYAGHTVGEKYCILVPTTESWVLEVKPIIAAMYVAHSVH